MDAVFLYICNYWQHVQPVRFSSPLDHWVTHPLDGVILIFDFVLTNFWNHLCDFRPVPYTFTSTIHLHHVTHIEPLWTDTTFFNILFSVTICYNGCNGWCVEVDDDVWWVWMSVIRSNLNTVCHIFSDTHWWYVPDTTVLVHWNLLQHCHPSEDVPLPRVIPNLHNLSLGPVCVGPVEVGYGVWWWCDGWW